MDSMEIKKQLNIEAECRDPQRLLAAIGNEMICAFLQRKKKAGVDYLDPVKIPVLLFRLFGVFQALLLHYQRYFEY